MLISMVFSGIGGLFAQDDDREPNRADVTVQVEQEAEYSEQIMQDYANAQYAAEFPAGDTPTRIIFSSFSLPTRIWRDIIASRGSEITLTIE